MFIHRIEVSQEKILELQNYKQAIQYYCFELFNKQVNEPNYYLGYIVELLKVDFEKIDNISTKIVANLTYRLHEDREYKKSEERLQVGL
jgi:hypothetical protein